MSMRKGYLTPFSPFSYSFRAIKRGEKTVETRAATKKYRDIVAGDTLIFRCGREVLEKKVKRVVFCRSVAVLLKKYKVEEIMPDRVFCKSLDESV